MLSRLQDIGVIEISPQGDFPKRFKSAFFLFVYFLVSFSFSLATKTDGESVVCEG